MLVNDLARKLAQRPSLQEIDYCYGRMRELGHELGIATSEPFIRAYHTDRGRHREKIIDQHSMTLVRNHYNWNVQLMAGQYDTVGVFGPGVLRYLDTGNVTRNTIYYASTPETVDGYFVIVTGATHGVLIGRGLSGESFESYNLATQITHGSGANQMLHSATVATEGWDAGAEFYWSKKNRVFDNSSGNSIEVTESGLIWAMSSAGGGYKFLMMRDFEAWGAGQPVADAESIEVEYEVRVYFP